MMSLLTSLCVLSCVCAVDIRGTCVCCGVVMLSSCGMMFECDCGVDVAMVFTLGDGSCTCLRLVLMDCRCPFTVASDRGGYRRTCLLEMSGKVVR